MNWTCQHRIPATLERVEAVLLDPATPGRLPEFAPALREVRAIERTEGEGWVERAAHYRPELGRLPPAVTPAMVEFDERTRWDLAAHAGRFVITPNLPARLQRRFRCDGTYRLDRDGDATIRTIEGVLRIDAPAVGPAIERLALRIVRRQFSGEAALLRALA